VVQPDLQADGEGGSGGGHDVNRSSSTGTADVTELRRLVAHLVEAAPDLRGLEATVAPEGADGRELAGAGPAGDGLRVHPEQGRDLARGEERFVCVDVVRHGSSFGAVACPTLASCSVVCPFRAS